MSKMGIIASRATTAPRYEITAAGLLEACRNFYRDPKNEADFQEWKKTKKGERGE